MIGKLHTLGIPHIIKESIQSAVGRCLRVQVAQCTCSSVAGILQRLGCACVVISQHGQIHDSFTLDFNQAFLEGNRERNRFDCLHLSENPFTRHPVASSRSLHKCTVTIGQVEGQTIEFQFHCIARLRQRRFRILRIIIVHQLQHPGIPAPQLLDVLCLIQAP
ncbi:hypothetical protein D3C74_308400 [compost metagenome]